MNPQPQFNVAYNQQTNNQFNDRRSVHASRTKMIFNGPIHGYIEHVTGEGPVIAYSEVTYVDRGHQRVSKTTVVSEQTELSLPASGPSRRSVKNTSKNDQDEDAVSDASSLISPSIPLPIDRSVLETEFRKASPEMQKYIQHLLRQYEKSYTEKNGQAGDADQR